MIQWLEFIAHMSYVFFICYPDSSIQEVIIQL